MCTAKLFTCVQPRYLHVYRQDIYMLTDKIFTCVQTSYLHVYRQAIYMCIDKLCTCVQTRYLHVYRQDIYMCTNLFYFILPCLRSLLYQFGQSLNIMSRFFFFLSLFCISLISNVSSLLC